MIKSVLETHLFKLQVHLLLSNLGLNNQHHNQLGKHNDQYLTRQATINQQTNTTPVGNPLPTHTMSTPPSIPPTQS